MTQTANKQPEVTAEIPSSEPESMRRFMEFCREKWPEDPRRNSRSVVLVSHFAVPAAVVAYAWFSNYLAKRTNSVIRSFNFSGNARFNRLYESFGAPVGLGLGPSDDKSLRRAAKEEAIELLKRVTNPWDIVNLTLDGLIVGDLIYDSFLRSALITTLDPEDPKLQALIIRTGVMVRQIRKYFGEHEVQGVIPDHFVYTKAGVLTRFAFQAGVPIYTFELSDRFLVRRSKMDPAFAGQRSPVFLPFHRFREWFTLLPPETQASGRARAADYLHHRLQGGAIDFRLGDTSSFGAVKNSRIFRESGRPRMLVMIHDFFDAPHSYRWSLFPDFYLWLTHLLTKAKETPFDWYVKDHPRLETPSRAKLNCANDELFEKLKLEFPHVTFLSRDVSNRQIVDEGVDAVFTMYGTCGHEFAYEGIKVVNAGDNPHIAFPFNLHPQSIEEYDQYILNADKLPLNIDRAEIEAYVYMRFFYYPDRFAKGAKLCPDGYFSQPRLAARQEDAANFDDFTAFSKEPQREGELTGFFDWLFEEDFAVIPKTKA